MGNGSLRETGKSQSWKLRYDDGKCAYPWVKPAEDAEIEDAEAIDLGDAYVVPGFIDAHVHLFCGESAYEECPGRSAAHHVCQGVKNAQELLKAGVVACRDLGAYEGYTLGVRDSIEKGEINGPKIIACGHALCATGGHGYQSVTNVMEQMR